jgi:hypothetical protein
MKCSDLQPRSPPYKATPFRRRFPCHLAARLTTGGFFFGLGAQSDVATLRSLFCLPQAVALGDTNNKAPSENIAAKSPASCTSAAFVNEPSASVTSATAIPKQRPAKKVLTILYAYALRVELAR